MENTKVLNDEAHAALAFARCEARKRNHDWIGAEHILLALIRQDEGLAVQILLALGVPIALVNERVEDVLATGDQPVHGIILAPRAIEVLRRAQEEATAFGFDAIRPEHLLLGLLAEGKSAASRRLGELGVSLAAARACLRIAYGQ